MPEIANLAVVVTADVTQAEQGLTSFGQKVSGVGSAITGALGTAAIGAIAGVGAAFVGSVKSAADFEKQISAISAVSGASATDLEGLRATALQLGKDTSFSASEAAAGMEEMVKAGVSLNDVMGGAGRAALDLAAAGGLSVAESATIASNAMNVFSLKGGDMAHVADVIAGAANASAIDVHDFGFSLSAVGAVAATVGLGLEDTATAIAVLGQAGLKGSDAGTSLKTMLLNLNPTSKAARSELKALGIITEDGANQFFDATGKAKGLAEISQILQTSMQGLTKEQQINALQTAFGTDAIRAAAIMAKAGAAGFDEMAASMSKVSAQAVATERLNNLWGSVEKLTGSLETAAIMLGSLVTPTLKVWADQATDAVNAVIVVLEQVPDVVTTIQQVLAGDWSPDASIQPFTLAVGELAVAFRDTLLPTITVVAGFVTGTLLPAFQSLAGFLMGHPEIIAGVVAAWAAFTVITTVVGWITGAIAAFGALSGAITAAGGVIAAIVAVLGGPLTIAILAVVAVIGLLTAAWIGNWGDIQGKTAAAIAVITPLIANMLTAIEGFWTAHGAAILAILEAAWTIILSQVTTALTVLSGVITAALQLISGDWEGAWTTITAVAQAIWDGWVVQLGAILDILVALFGPTFTAIAAAFTSGLATIQGLWDAGWAAINAALVAAWNLLTTENQTRITALIAATTLLWTTLGELWATGTAALTTTLTTWWDETTTAWTTAQTTISETVAPWWETIKGFWDAALKAIGDALGAAWAGIVTATAGLFERIKTEFTSAVGTLGQAATELGSAIMDALITAVNAKVSAMLDAVTGAVSGALAAARNLIGGAGGSGGGSGGNQAWSQIAREEGVDPALLQSLIEQESRGKQSARSGAGAIGLTQLMPGTAAGLGVDPYDELQNVRGGARYLKQMIDQFGSVERALAAYNAGPGGGVPSESAAYAQRVVAGAGKFRVPDGVASAQRGMIPQLGQQTLAGGTLSAAEAAAFCGPAAAMWFANIYGRMPTKTEAEEMARQVGWTPEWGMTGPGSEQRLLAAMGVSSSVDFSPTPAEIGALAGQNVPFMLSTQGGNGLPGHYFQVQGGSLAGLNVGASGTALAGGSATMSLDQITALSGAINGIITLAPQMGAALAQSSAVGGAALQGLLVSATTLSDGSTVAITQMGDQITASIVSSSGQVVATYGAMATAVTTDSATMATAALTSVTNLGTGIMTTIADTAGSTITTVTDMSGQVTSQYATLANGVSLTMGDMGAGVLTSTTDLGTGVMTTVQDMSGNYITTITDLAGNVTSQYTSLAADATAASVTMSTDVTAEVATMSTGVTDEVATMSEIALTSVTDLGDGTLTITQNAAGEMIATITDMAGEVTSTYTSMGSDVTGTHQEMVDAVVEAAATMESDVAESVSQMVSEVQDSFGDLSSAADDATAALEGIGDVEIQAPDVGDLVDAMKDVQKAAEKAADAVDDVGDGGGNGGGGDDDHRQAGGPVRAGHPYIVGEAGSELFVPGRSGTIIPHHALAAMSKVGQDLGLPIAQGVAAGIAAGAGEVYDATRSLIETAQSARAAPAPVPSYAGRGGSGASETLVIDFQIDGQTAERIYITGRELAALRGRDTAYTGTYSGRKP